MKKGVFIEQVRRRIYGGKLTQDAQIRVGDLWYLVDQCIAQLAVMNYQINKQAGITALSPEFLVSYEITLKLDSGRNRMYADLPSKPISLPFSCWEIIPKQDSHSAYIPQRPGTNSLFRGLEAHDLETQKGFEVEGTRVWFNHNVDRTNKGEVLIARLPASAEALEEDQEMPVPKDYEKRLLDMVEQEVYRQLGVKPDEGNDDIDERLGVPTTND